jgi:hypothetical protein
MLQSFTSHPAVLKTAVSGQRGILGSAALQASSSIQPGAADQTMVMAPGGTFEASGYDPGSRWRSMIAGSLSPRFVIVPISR